MRVFLASPWIPAEWVRAHGLESEGIWFAEAFRRSTPPLSAGNCAFAENVVQFAESQADAAVVFPTACDQLRRGYDAAVFRSSARAFLFNVPATQTPAARRLYRAELERLGNFLRQLGGTTPTPERLGAELDAAGQVRSALRTIAPFAEARSLARAVARFCRDGSLAEPLPPTIPKGVPLAIVGGPLSQADWPLFDVIAAAGGFVALNGTDTGERILCPTWENRPDPLAVLVDGYFDHLVDVFRRPNTGLYSWLQERLPARQVRGIVLWCFTGCDLWRAEWQTLREACHLPVLLLETDDAAGLAPRDVSRLQAFVETLQ